MEGTAHARLALGPDRAVHHLNQSFGYRESKPGASVLSRRRSVRLRECLEQPGTLFGCHPDAAVADGEPQLYPLRQLLLERNRYQHLAAFRKLDRVIH